MYHITFANLASLLIILLLTELLSINVRLKSLMAMSTALGTLYRFIISNIVYINDIHYSQKTRKILI